jgi:hypothetical protein
MKILKTKVHWWGPNVLNAPDLQILVDKIPKFESLVYKRKQVGYQWLFLAEKEGYVKFFVWSGKGNDRGFDGMSIPIKVLINRKVRRVTLKGPWSSHCGVMNLAGFPHSMEVSIIDNPRYFEQGYTFMAGAITIPKVQEAIKLLSERVELIKTVSDNVWALGEISYELKRVET